MAKKCQYWWSTVVETKTEANLVLLISHKPLLWQENKAYRVLTWSLKSVAFEYQPCQLIVYNARVILTRKSWKFTNCERLFFCQKWLQKHLGILFCIKYDIIMIVYWIKIQKILKASFCDVGRFLFLSSCLQFFHQKGVLSKSACHSTKGQIDVKKIRIQAKLCKQSFQITVFATLRAHYCKQTADTLDTQTQHFWGIDMNNHMQDFS